jgi:transcriptional regulator with XRE-family HTH domain
MVNLLKIKELAKQKRITIRELAMAANITEQGLQRLIRTNSTTVETIDLIARKLGVPVGVFFDEFSPVDYNNSHIGDISGNDNTTVVGQGNYVGGKSITAELSEMKVKMKRLEAKVKEACAGQKVSTKTNRIKK